MAKRTSLIKKQQIVTVKNAVKKPEFWIGVLTVVVVLGVGLYVGVKEIRKLSQQKTMTQKIISPVPLTVSPAQPTLSIAPVAVSKQIKKLADTSGAIVTYALENDNFWNISVRMCGNGRYYKTIQSMNGYEYRSLQKGDAITIYCW